MYFTFDEAGEQRFLVRKVLIKRAGAHAGTVSDGVGVGSWAVAPTPIVIGEDVNTIVDPCKTVHGF
ncbi:hypothetical protein ACPOL_1390 [Acidisarcina polymorpha]|uniref:Uncharacterized protein n=1 Tax=Acidisarcina polymorpha TaxID=2211140 RepID=A0A2Z5FV43_9BACT|nr:hypothetical protein ACPOL_1390 [Acidisarcina polymorpha]